MTANAVIPQAPSGKVDAIPATPAAAPQKPIQYARARAYWGDRLTIRFWLFCFAVMAGMNLIEAVHRMLLFFFQAP
jgi:hypothetical protein